MNSEYLRIECTREGRYIVEHTPTQQVIVESRPLHGKGIPGAGFKFVCFFDVINRPQKPLVRYPWGDWCRLSEEQKVNWIRDFVYMNLFCGCKRDLGPVCKPCFEAVRNDSIRLLTDVESLASPSAGSVDTVGDRSDSHLL